MNENQVPKLDTIKVKKTTVLGKEILGKYTDKKDLNRKAGNYLEKHLSVPSISRIDSCHDFMRFLTTEKLDKRRLELANSCGNRFCPICTWKTARKDAIKLAIMSQAISVKEKHEFIFLTLTSPNVTEENLHSEIDRFNKAINKLFKRKKVAENIQGYVRKLEVTTDQEKYITDELFSRKKNYFEKRGLSVGDANPQYNTYNPHVHIILSVKKRYFKDGFISQAEWLEMWRSCMKDERITQVDVRKVRKGQKNIDGAILEVAKYTAKSSDLYHSERVFDTYYGALKGRQLLVYSGTFKDYAKQYEKGLLDEFKQADDTVYTHLLRSVWQSSNYENTIRELTPEEFEKYNERALKIEESDDIE